MFEVGKTYRIIERDGDETTYSTVLVEKVDLPLIAITQADRTIILNTSAASFVSAELVDQQARTAALGKVLDGLPD